MSNKKSRSNVVFEDETTPSILETTGIPSSEVTAGIPSSQVTTISHVRGSTVFPSSLSHVYGGTVFPSSLSHVHGDTGFPSSSSHVRGDTGFPSSSSHVHGDTGFPSSISHVHGGTGFPSSSSHVHGATGFPLSTSEVQGATGFPSSLHHDHTAVSRNVLQQNSNELLDLDGVLSERLLSLKRSYSGYKGSLTRMYNVMELAMSSSNVAVAMDRKNRIEDVFGKLIDIYNKLTQILPMEQQEAYVRDQVVEVERRNKYLFSYQEWLSSRRNVPPSSSEDLSTSSLASSSEGFSRLSSLLKTQQRGFTPPNSSVPTNIVADAKNLRNEDNPPENSIASAKTSVSSRVSRTSAKAKFEKAQAKLRRLAQKKELERKLEEFHLTAEMEDAEIELKVLDERESDDEKLSNESLGLPLQDRQEMVNKYVESVNEQLKVEHKHNDNSMLGSPKLRYQNADVNVTNTPTNNYPQKTLDLEGKATLPYASNNCAQSDGLPEGMLSCIDSPQVQRLLERQQDTMEQVVRNLSMPKREYMFFDGDPLVYPLFMKNFEINVESKESNQADRLNYLIQYCTGKAKEAIEHCVIMDQEKGYIKAKEILHKNFGRTHIVAKAFLDKIVKGPPIKINDGERLSQLSRDMETCMLGSSQLGLEANLDSLETLGKIVARLPVPLKAKWAEKANQLYEHGMTPQFSHLAKFVEERAAVANTYFGQLVQDAKPGKDVLRTTTKIPLADRATTLAATSTSTPEAGESRNTVQSPKCQLCGAAHYMDQCQQFTTKDLEQRIKVIMEKRLCRLCLKRGHQANECRRTKVCGVDGCNSRHHSLLHSAAPAEEHSSKAATSVSSPQVQPPVTSPTSSPRLTDGNQTMNSARCSALQTELQQISLKVVPVKVSVPDSDQVIETYAFLDDGSDTSMCLRSLAEDLGAPCTPVNFLLSTMSGSEQRSEMQLSLDVVGVSTGKGVRLEKLWTTEQLPISNSTLTNKELDRWPHLNDVRLAEVSNKEVTILIGNDAPEALCPLEVKSGGKGQPYAVRTLLGWAVAGPLERKRAQVAKVNSIHVDQVLGCDQPEKVTPSVDFQLEQMYNSEFTENSATVRECLSLEDRRAKAMMEKSVRFVNGHYQVGLPWKYDFVELPNNRGMAEKRANLLKKRFLRNPELLRQYTETVEMYIAKGHATRVLEEERSTDN